MDDEAATPQHEGVSDAAGAPSSGAGEASWTAADPDTGRWVEAAPSGAMADDLPDPHNAQTAPTAAVTPWWSNAATATVAPEPPVPAPAATATEGRSRGARRTFLLGALIGALVAALVSGSLFALFDNDSSKSTANTTPQALSGENANNTVPLPSAGRSGIDIHAVLARIQPAVVRIKITTSDGAAAGTGIVIDPNGTIVTNAHVVQNANTIQVQLPNGDIAPGKAKGVDPAHDLAVITIPRKHLASAVLGDSDQLNVGDPVIAVGNALDLGISVTTGIVSAIDRDVPEENGNLLVGALQTDAAINPGNSGGPLVNAAGEVIGINTAIAPPSDASNVGFAIAISAAKPIIADLADGRAPEDALLGVTGQDVTPELVTQHHLKVNSGVYVEQVAGSTAAARAGITRGDVIVSLDRRTVGTTEQMRRYIRRHRPGDKVQVIYVRSDGSRRTVTVTLGANTQQQ